MKAAIIKPSNPWRIQTTLDHSKRYQLRYALYHRGALSPNRCVVFINGRTEWIEKYMGLPLELGLPEDCGFLTWDHRGQGASGGDKSFIDRYDSYGNDARKVIAEAIGELPYVIVGHSMGGLIGLYGMLKGYLNPKAMLLSSPLLRLPNEPVPRFWSRPLSICLTLMGLGRMSSGVGRHDRHVFEKNRLTHSREAFEFIQTSPYRIPGATFGWITETFKALDYVYDPANIQNLSCPTRILGGDHERVVDPSGWDHWVELAQTCAPCPPSLTIVSGARHELFNESSEYRKVAVGIADQFLSDYY